MTHLRSTALAKEFADTGKYICVFDPLDGSSILDASHASPQKNRDRHISEPWMVDL
jgi:hypothetical protein